MRACEVDYLFSRHRRAVSRCPQCSDLLVYGSDELLRDGGYAVHDECHTCESIVTTSYDATWVKDMLGIWRHIKADVRRRYGLT